MTTTRLTWHKSSHSDEEYNCVEIAAVPTGAPVQVPEPPNGWRKSSHSGEEYSCVEAASTPGAVAVRDSKDADGPRLMLDAATWRTLSTNIKAGRYDLSPSS